MNKLTKEEAKAHKDKLKQIRDRSIRARQRLIDGDITMKKMGNILREVKEEEFNYIRESQVFLYFGQLFKGEKNV